MKLRGIGMVKVNKKTNLKDKSYEWLLTEKMKLEHEMKSKIPSVMTHLNIERMEKISHINSEIFARR